MARLRRESESTISLFPFLSVLCCAIGVLIVIISAQNLLAVGTADQTIEIAGTHTGKEPVYVECAKDSVVIYPQGLRIPMPVSDEDASDQADAVDPALNQFMDELYADRENRYLVLLIRPSAIRTFTVCRILADRRGSGERNRIRTGWDALVGEGKLVFTRNGEAIMETPEVTR